MRERLDEHQPPRVVAEDASGSGVRSSVRCPPDRDRRLPRSTPSVGVHGDPGRVQRQPHHPVGHVGDRQRQGDLAAVGARRSPDRRRRRRSRRRSPPTAAPPAAGRCLPGGVRRPAAARRRAAFASRPAPPRPSPGCGGPRRRHCGALGRVPVPQPEAASSSPAADASAGRGRRRSRRRGCAAPADRVWHWCAAPARRAGSGPPS